MKLILVDMFAALLFYFGLFLFVIVACARRTRCAPAAS